MDAILSIASPRRLLAGFAGPLLLGLGSGISISAGFGSFGFAVLLDGVRQSIGLPLWFSQFAITSIFYGIAWWWARIPLGVGTVSALLLVGPAISLGASLTPDTTLLFGNLVAFVTGILMFACGISLAAAAAFGPDGVTALSLAAEKRHGWPVPRANFLWNALAIAGGASLGGNVGAGTLVGLFSVPVLIGILLPVLRRHIASVDVVTRRPSAELAYRRLAVDLASSLRSCGLDGHRRTRA